jgi:hypothetical protein
MKFITGNRNTRKQWNDNIVDTKKDFNFINTNQHSDGTNHQGNQNDSVSDSDKVPQFQSEKQYEKL